MNVLLGSLLRLARCSSVAKYRSVPLLQAQTKVYGQSAASSSASTVCERG